MIKNRQKLRKGIILVSFFLFPAIFYYLSPVLIIQASVKGIVNGSFIMFVLMFLSSLVLGRAYCGWVCPAAGCQEAMFLTRDKKVNKGDFIKWLLWLPWISAIIILYVKAGGIKSLDFFYQTRYGLSVDSVQSLITYFVVLFVLIIIPAFVFGKRSFCHHICWMAPFMIIGRGFRNRFKWVSLRLKTYPENCNHCHTCSDNCPMSLPVEAMVNQNKMETAECILCGTCIDGCEHNAIEYAFYSSGN